MCMPGDNVDMDVELITPIAIEEGLRFAIREGGRLLVPRGVPVHQRGLKVPSGRPKTLSAFFFFLCEN